MSATASAPAPARSRGTGRFHTLTVTSVEALTDDAAAVTFDVPPDLADDYAFSAGQSLTLRRFLDGVEHRRTYSICAPAGAAPRIGIREIPDGLFSRWLVRDVRPGDQVEVQTPSGSFRADPGAGGRHLLVAAGSGITPMLSIAATILANPEIEVTLLYGNRTTSSVMFAEEIADLKNRYGSRLQLVHVLSREPRDVELFSGRLDADRLRALIGALVPIHQVDDVWLCGPFAMIGDARAVVGEFGIPSERVHFELFYVDEPPPVLRRPDAVADGVTSQVTVTIDGLTSTAPMSRSDTILDSAQATRSDVPFACKGGVCGTCRARVRSGEVDMLRNYALEQAEVDAGFVLTCQSLPVSAEVSVDYDA